jgi:hypothetical protein
MNSTKPCAQVVHTGEAGNSCLQSLNRARTAEFLAVAQELVRNSSTILFLDIRSNTLNKSGYIHRQSKAIYVKDTRLLHKSESSRRLI